MDPLGVEHVEHAGIADLEAAPRQVERGAGDRQRLTLGVDRLLVMDQRLAQIGDLAERLEDCVMIGCAGRASLLGCRSGLSPSRRGIISQLSEAGD